MQAWEPQSMYNYPVQILLAVLHQYYILQFHLYLKLQTPLTMIYTLGEEIDSS